MQLVRTERFKKSYQNLDKQSQKTIAKALRLLVENMFHPSLRTRKMEGYHNPYRWEARGNMDLRITFEYEKPELLILRNCGHHDKTLRNP